SALRFADPMVQAIWNALLVFDRLPTGFCNRDLRNNLAALLGQRVEHFTQGRMSYQLRRLRLHGLIERWSATRTKPVAQAWPATSHRVARLQPTPQKRDKIPASEPALPLPRTAGTKAVSSWDRPAPSSMAAQLIFMIPPVETSPRREAAT